MPRACYIVCIDFVFGGGLNMTDHATDHATVLFPGTFRLASDLFHESLNFAILIDHYLIC